MRTFIFSLLAVLGVIKPVTANSYLEMITTKPKGYVSEQSASNNTVVMSNVNPTIVYVGGVKTKSPVVTSDYHKYQAWLKSQENYDKYPYLHSDVQRFLYFLSGAFAVRLAYDIIGPNHRHHLIH